MVGEVTSLAHETGNDSVETRFGISVSLFSGAQRTEVFGGLGSDIRSQFHGDSSDIFVADLHIEVNLGVGHQRRGGTRKGSGGSGTGSERRGCGEQGSRKHGGGFHFYFRKKGSSKEYYEELRL